MSLYSNVPDPQAEAEAYLQKTPLFRGLTDTEIAHTAACLRQRQFAAGVTLFHQDMPGMMLYLIQSGSVRVYGLGRTGQELTFEIFGKGDIFGELSLLDDKHHSATAMTLSPSVIWLLPKTELDRLLDQNTRFSRSLIRVLVNRIRSRALHAEAMTFQDVQGRLAYVLLYLADRHGKKTPAGIEIDVPMTQVDLASFVGAARESVNKALSGLRSLNMVKMDGSHILVTKPDRLQLMIQERGR